MPADSGLRCPKCEYNLTGVTENRCPECGETFDPARLQAILAGAPAPIPIWDDPSIHVAVRFIRICLLTWFAPHRLSRSFPRRYDFRSARRFRRWTLFITATIWMVPIGLSLDPTMLAAFVIGLAGGTAGIIVLEAALAGVWGAFLWPSETRASTLYNPDASESYIGLVGMFRSFILLATCAIASLVLADGLSPIPQSLEPILMTFVALWWWLALAAAVAVQPGSNGGKVGAILLVPVVVAISMCIASAVGMLTFLVLGVALSILF